MSKANFPRAKGKKPTKVPVKKPACKRGSLKAAIFELFDRKSVGKVAYEEAERLAKQVKPDTKFNNYHFSWYRNNYKKTRAK